MRPLTKLYVKTFLFTGVPYGLLMMGFDLLAGDKFDLWKLLFLTFFFSTVMYLTLVTFHKYRLKKDGNLKLTDENLGVSQVKKINTKLGKAELVNKLKETP